MAPRRGLGVDSSSRLSLGATDLITARLAAARPDLFVTDQPMVSPARYSLFINIADWM